MGQVSNAKISFCWIQTFREYTAFYRSRSIQCTELDWENDLSVDGWTKNPHRDKSVHHYRALAMDCVNQRPIPELAVIF